MISVGAAMLGAAGIGTISSLAGGYLGRKGANEASARQIAWERERAKNAHQWEVEDLKKAGLNPILSAGGTGAVTGSIDAVNTKESYENALNNIGNSAATYAQMRLDLKKQKADIENAKKITDAQVQNLNAQTARILTTTPEEVKNLAWQRRSTAEKFLGENYTNTAIDAIKQTAYQAGLKYGKSEYKQPKPKVKPQKLIFRDNKHSYMD